MTKEHRITRQRMVILDELRKVSSHPSADDMYEIVRKILPRISLGTVYRNLEVLTEMGLIRKLEINGGVMRFDGDVSKHYHLNCVQCGKVFDIPEDEVSIQFSSDTVNGFHVIDYTLNFVGLCDKCNNSKSA